MDDNLTSQKTKQLFDYLLEYIQLILKNKFFIIILSLGLSAAIAVVLIITAILPPDVSPLPNSYRANASLFLIEPSGSSMSSLLSSLGIEGGDRGSYESSYSQMAMQILRTRSFVDKLIEEFKLKEKYKFNKSGEGSLSDLRKMIIAKSRYSFDPNGRMLYIGYEDTDAQFAKDIVNKMVDRLNDWFSSKGGTMRIQQKKLLEEKLVEISQDIAEMEAKLKELQKKYGTLSIEESAQSQINVLSNLQSQLILKELEIKNYSNISRVEDRRSITLKSERDNILELINQVKEGNIANGIKLPPQSQLPEIAQEFSHLNTNLQIQRKIYETLAQQYEVVKLAQGSEPVFEVLEYAEIPDKSGPQRSLIFLGGVIASVGISIGIVFCRQFIKFLFSSYQRKIKSSG
jgi:uncharacterized protein involved in exopolysaccharide biosynthesis